MEEISAPPRPSWAKARWADTRRQARQWRVIGASEFVVRLLTFGIWDPPTRPFLTGRILPAIPQTESDLAFGLSDLAEGCLHGVYQEVPRSYALHQMRSGCYVSSAFVDWNKDKGRFIINLKLQSTHWDKKSVLMESLSAFGSCLTQGDHMLSFDWKGGIGTFVYTQTCGTGSCFTTTDASTAVSHYLSDGLARHIGSAIF